ncbi:hypothetical protein SEUCBS139899_005021 [Sporothrix eucalyptigena]|uniref:Uncharacterized protein n=1 Tax=Sporothrix eucalyptigena TaxID=1812306 RepID=A0ABP0AWW4_9PEZI
MSSSTSSISSSSSKGFWPRELVFAASPNPTTLEGGRQLEGAPMCPCNSCWEYGSHALAPPKASKAPKAPKEKKSPLQFLKRANASKDSVASDMRPLQQPVALASAASSVYGEY